MIVVDANVWLAGLVDQSAVGERCREELLRDQQWLVPAHAPLEVLRGLGKLERAGAVSQRVADAAAAESALAHVRVVEMDAGLLGQVWPMRHNVSVYDAPYLLIALRYDSSLLTLDQRLVRAAAPYGVRTLFLGRTSARDDGEES